MAATAMEHDGGGAEVVTPGELLGASSSLTAGSGAYADGHSVRRVRSPAAAESCPPLPAPPTRQQDVRATEIDKVDMYQSYRPGDIVRALVLSLGDARAYYLSTAKNELGVVSAQSIAGYDDATWDMSDQRRWVLGM
ncbi:hypothetical protein ACQ4PT_017585 [Festuca glaucescens]